MIAADDHELDVPDNNADIPAEWLDAHRFPKCGEGCELDRDHPGPCEVDEKVPEPDELKFKCGHCGEYIIANADGWRHIRESSCTFAVPAVDYDDTAAVDHEYSAANCQFGGPKRTPDLTCKACLSMADDDVPDQCIDPQCVIETRRHHGPHKYAADHDSQCDPRGASKFWRGTTSSDTEPSIPDEPVRIHAAPRVVHGRDGQVRLGWPGGPSVRITANSVALGWVGDDQTFTVQQQVSCQVARGDIVNLHHRPTEGLYWVSVNDVPVLSYTDPQHQPEVSDETYNLIARYGRIILRVSKISAFLVGMAAGGLITAYVLWRTGMNVAEVNRV